MRIQNKETSNIGGEKMTQEDKQLLFIDLCGRLPYGVMIEVQNELGKLTSININDDGEVIIYSSDCDEDAKIEYCKPYLRPISSMTKEEEKEYYELYYDAPQFKNGWRDTRYLEGLHVDWFNRNHFDYRGLISKGLAIKVTKENNPYKE